MVSPYGKKFKKISFVLTVMLIIFSSIIVSDAQAFSIIFSQNTIVSSNGSPILIYRDSYSPTSLVHIVIKAPDFNSNSYAIDTIGDDFEHKIIISTRESSIPYRLVETGPDTGVFSGEIILSGTTSACSPVCGPTDGFLAASGDDAITVSFTYAKNRIITSTSIESTQGKTNNQAVPEFGSAIEIIILVSFIGVLAISRKFTHNFS